MLAEALCAESVKLLLFSKPLVTREEILGEALKWFGADVREGQTFVLSPDPRLYDLSIPYSRFSEHSAFEGHLGPGT